MTFDICKILLEAQNTDNDLYSQHVNPQFAKMLQVIGFDRCYTKAQGAYLWDKQGQKYLDMLGGFAVFNMGRNHPVIKKALTDWLEADFPNWVQFDAPLLAGLVAGELKKLVPYSLEHVYFTNCGTEGVETAIKFAKCATQRPALVYCENGFHGLTCGSLSICGDPHFKAGFGPLLPHCRQVPFNDLDALEEALAPGDVAAFVVEPIQGKGVNLPDPGYLQEACALCHRHGTLFVADEVQSGMGRTGTFLALEQEGQVEPDIVILSKALSGGYVPVGAVLTAKWVWQKVFSNLERSVIHSSTFKQGGLAMVAALASLHVLTQENLMENAKQMGTLLYEGLNAMKPRYQFLHEIRQRGLMVGIQLGKPQSFGLRAGWKLIQTMDPNLFPQAVVIPLMDDYQILTQVAGHNLPVIKLIPPLVINHQDVQRFLFAFDKVMKNLHKFPGPAWEVIKKLSKLGLQKRSRKAMGSQGTQGSSAIE